MEFSTTLLQHGGTSGDIVEALNLGAALDHPHGSRDEALIADARAGLSPAQMVERKLATLLKSQPLPVSYLMTAKRTRRPS